MTSTGTLVDGFNLIYNFKNAHKVRGQNVAVLRSGDKGATWDAKATIVDVLRSAGVRNPFDQAPVRTGDIIPEIAAGPSNTVYLVWQDARSTGGARDQIALARSTDGGVTWTTVSLAINPQVAGNQAFNPVVRVLPDGTVGVLFQDFRNDNPADAPLTTSTWLLHSHDGGQTWTETKIGGDFDMTGAAVARGYFLGDYYALDVAGPTSFTAVYGQATGTRAAPASNIYSATIAP